MKTPKAPMLLKPVELQIDPNNPFANDAFERKEVVDSFVRIVTDLKGPFVIAVDSPWGTGKTIFLKMLQASLENNGHPCMYFNAWETDFAEDPLIAFVGELDSLLNGFCPEEGERQETIKSVKRMAGAMAKKVVPATIRIATMGAIDIAPEIERLVAEATGALGADAVENYLKDKKVMDDFHEKLNLALSTAKARGKKLPVVIFVDELDRCRPLYAIELLERIKHLFNVESAIFVVALDKAQLSISLGAVYGAGFNSTEYLRRFFDLELRLTPVSGDKFCESLINRMALEEFFASRPAQVAHGDAEGLKNTFRDLSRLFGLTPRAQERCMVLLALGMTATPINNHFYPVQTVIMAVLRTGAEEIYNKVSREAGSVGEIIEHLNKLRMQRGGIEERYWAILQGYILSMRDRRDPHAEQILKKHQGARQSVIADGGYDENLDLIVTIANDFENRGASLKAIIKRIDIAAQFQN
ncbi:MAG: P-loop NTPase fold protein [Azonexus sp.]